MAYNPLLRPALLPSENQKAAMDAAATPSATNPFATVALALPAVNLTATGPRTSAFLVGGGAPVNQMTLVYLDSSSQWQNTDADAIGTSIGLIGIALETKTPGNAILVALPGSFVRYDTWNWTPGQLLYIDTATTGAIVSAYTTGTDDVIRPIGWAVTADVIYFEPSTVYITHV